MLGRKFFVRKVSGLALKKNFDKYIEGKFSARNLKPCPRNMKFKICYIARRKKLNSQEKKKKPRRGNKYKIILSGVYTINKLCSYIKNMANINC
jgi:hypothetical protein